MEFLNLFIDLMKCISPSITTRWRDHRDVYKNMAELKERSEKLNFRKSDIESKRDTEIIEGETELKAEVKNWLNIAVKIISEVGEIEEKVRKKKLFRAGLGKLVNLKIAELDELYEKGVFSGELVIHLPRPCGFEKPTTSLLGGETTFKRKMDEIWGCLLDDEIGKVGVYGMGGIGKTTALEHSHNRLLKDRKEDFKSVIWVEVSKESDIFKLQDKIARRLDLDLSKDNEVEYRAHKLYAELRKKMRYVLILDDLWEVYSLKEVGIPEPTPENRCKLVVTTQSLEVCRGMSCKQIEMEVLSEDEALKLFVDQVGGSVMSDPNLEVIAKEVVRKCAGLPREIVTIAGSLKDKVGINEWQIIYRRFIDERLKLSYDRLSDKKLQECLLYCAFYPEDDLIERETLIEHLMAEGIIEEIMTRQSRISKGHVMLNNLVNVGLLDDACDSEDKKCVKMPNSVRDMALKITSGSPRYSVKAGVGLRSVPSEENWDDDLEKVSLMGRWRDHRDAYKNMEELRKRSEKLNFRIRDIESKRDIELIEGETELKAEVKNWLESVGKIGGEVDEIEEKAGKAKLLPADLLERVTLKRVELDELYEKGVFPEGLVIHLPSPFGYEKPTTSLLGGETTFKRKMEEIWRCLSDDKIGKAGVYGMGGIGKTTALEHTHNRLLKDRKEGFKSVIWVEVSKESSVFNLQDKIARKLDLDLSKDKEVEFRAQKLHFELRKKMRYVLILDDLWEVYDLKEVGIPDPTPENRCKLVVTTRSREVCCGMSCKPIKMEVLSEDEALKLFVDKVGGSVMSDPKFKVLAKEVVGKCGGLPRAIVTIAGSVKDKVDINEWQIIYRRFIDEGLKSSYDGLSDKKLQDCLLYCSLYPEDDLIEREMLIEHLMADGIIEEIMTRQSRISKGHVMLNNLVNVGLLDNARDSENKKCVKMPDLVRDMALKITSGSSRYSVKAGVGLRSVPSEEDWDDELEKVSLMGNGKLLNRFSEVEPTKCRGLSTLLLQRNTFLSIPNRFFLHMRMLNVLDLSETDIYDLPESFSDLTNLTALFLRNCQHLRSVPSLAKLVNLKLLDLYGSGVIQIPDGLNMLRMLRYLNLSNTGITSVSAGILCNFFHLQYLEFIPGSRIAAIQFRAEEITNLGKLESVKGVLNDLDCFNAFIRCFQLSGLMPSYILGAGGSIVMKNTALEEGNKVVILSKFTSPDKKWPLLLPKDVEIFHIERCDLNVYNLCELASFKTVTKLTKLTLVSCADIRYAFSYSLDIFPLLQSLEELILRQLRDFRGVILRESGTSSVGNAFSSLKILRVSDCPEMKKLGMISSLPNLEELVVSDCSNLTEISFGDGYSLDDDEGEEISSSADTITLPKLSKLDLKTLPKLQSLPLLADFVKRVRIIYCPELRRIPMLDRDNFPYSLENVEIDKESWGLWSGIIQMQSPPSTQ